MKVYVEAQSKAALIRRLAAGEEITGLNYSMFGGGGYYKLDNTLEDGTIIAIYSQMSGGNPVAKSWGTWTNGVLKAETFEGHHDYHAETLMCPICDSVCDHDSQNLYDCSSCEIMWLQDEDGGFDFLEAESIPAGVGVIFK